MEKFKCTMSGSFCCIAMCLVIIISLAALFLTGCRTTGGIFIGNTLPVPAVSVEEGPPPWAPAHGNRAKHMYRYYPYHGIYFEEKTGVYFYISDGRWHTSVTLPLALRITVNDFVTLDMDTDRPYEYHKDVVKKYPPGQQKNKAKDQDRGNKGGNKKGR